MKFLIDESVEYSIVMYLRQEKHDVIAVCEESSGIRDEDVLRRAVIDQRVLITNDKDFGMLIYFRRMKHHGVVLLRLSDADILLKIKRLHFLLEQHGEKLETHFVVVEQDSIRIRKLVE